jgi:uncharacterized RDD family membrane protein YckC
MSDGAGGSTLFGRSRPPSTVPFLWPSTSAAPYAQWGRRCVGALVDCCVMFVMAIMQLSVLSTGATQAVLELSWIALWMAYVICSLGLFSCTLGMRVAGIRLASLRRRGRIAWRQVVVRTIGSSLWLAWPCTVKSVELASGDYSPDRHLRRLAELALVSLVSYLWPLWDPRRQTLHDKLAGTVVIRRRQDPTLRMPSTMPHRALVEPEPYWGRLRRISGLSLACWCTLVVVGTSFRLGALLVLGGLGVVTASVCLVASGPERPRRMRRPPWR